MCVWIIFVAGVTMLQWFDRQRFLRSVEDLSYSLRLEFRGIEQKAEGETNIIIVAVDDASLDPIVSDEDFDLNPDIDFLVEPFPWDRPVHGIVAEKFLKAGAKVVAFDSTFYTENPGNADFLDIIERHPGEIVIGFDYPVLENDMGKRSPRSLFCLAISGADRTVDALLALWG